MAAPWRVLSMLTCYRSALMTAAPSIVATGEETALPIILTRSSFDSSRTRPRVVPPSRCEPVLAPAGKLVHHLRAQRLLPLQRPEVAVVDVRVGDHERLAAVRGDRPGRGLDRPRDAGTEVGDQRGCLSREVMVPIASPSSRTNPGHPVAGKQSAITGSPRRPARRSSPARSCRFTRRSRRRGGLATAVTVSR